MSKRRTTSMAELPTELVYEILRVAAESSTEFCLTLALVSSWARRLILPHFCSTVIVKSNDASSKFTQFLTRPKAYNPSVYSLDVRTDLVRSIWFEASSYHIVDVLFMCRRIKQVAVSKEGFDWLRRYSGGWDQSGMKKGSRSLSPHSEDRSLQMFLLLKKSQLNVWTRTNASNTHVYPPIYRQIIDLRLSDCGSYAPHKLNLPLFPRLARFAIPFYDSSIHSLTELKNSVEGHAGLEVLVLVMVKDWISEQDRDAAVAWVRGMRDGSLYAEGQEELDSASSSSVVASSGLQVYFVESQSDTIRQEWEADARFGWTIWSRAVDYTAQVLSSPTAA